MQIDTGACVSILPEYLYRGIPELKRKPLIGDKVSLTTYQGEPWMCWLKLRSTFKIKKLKKKYAKVFGPQIGEIKGKEVNLHLKPNTVPKFCKARPLPYTIKPLVDKELDVLERAGIIARVPYSDWLTPIVVVRKSSNAIRMCADYKVTLNPVLETEHYKLPTTEEMFSQLAKEFFFSHLDFASAYQQLKVSPKT
ncbi:hypothetical protein JTE90_013186 [Oedothorax gibbosus]|uniref:Reverse transcriptase n=1 Tax=Oedothorax gibbosus TaxID=931172 RepID=A0AAV6TT88_9ARAC|nr:hypothetical protein JTE90_013186 [Oedothorax gibbosus]